MSLWFLPVCCSALQENVVNPKGISAYIYETTQYGSVLSKGNQARTSANGCASFQVRSLAHGLRIGMFEFVNLW